MRLLRFEAGSHTPRLYLCGATPQSPLACDRSTLNFRHSLEFNLHRSTTVLVYPSVNGRGV